MEYNEVYVTKTQEEITKNAPVYTVYGKRNARILTFGKDGKPFVIEFKKGKLTNEISKMGIALRRKVMKLFYVWDIKTKIYAGDIECQKNAEASAKAKKDIYNNPANSTDKEPLPYKEMNEIKWNGKKWYYDPMK